MSAVTPWRRRGCGAPSGISNWTSRGAARTRIASSRNSSSSPTSKIAKEGWFRRVWTTSGGSPVTVMPRMTSIRSSRLLARAALACWVCGAGIGHAAPASATSDAPSPAEAGVLAENLSELYARVRPVVVGVVSSRVWHDPNGLFASKDASVSCRRLVASGILLGERGCVVTTARAAQPGDSIVIHLGGDHHVRASYLGMDPALHIAVLRLEAPGPHPSIPVARNPREALPDWVAVIAYGPWSGAHPQEPSLTLSQRASIETVPTRLHGTPSALWQIDAPLSPGNGGGALVTLEGHWLGLITGVVSGAGRGGARTRSPSPGASAVVVPAEVVAQAVAEIEAGGRPSQGFLGLRAVPREAAEAGAGPASGVRVAEVLPGSPASCAGVLPGDVVHRFAGVEVGSVIELTQLVRAHEPGDRVSLDLSRGDRSGRLELLLGDRHAAGLYMTRRRQQINEQRALELELGRLAERREQIERRLELLRRMRDQSSQVAPNPDASQTPRAR
ncbi:MAG: PDZ domain-containing protein [Candidatus Eisenbacteria bacterium]|nr:PDZ domain-containing protein [Candidatus Eisenbacteria bacterium]